MSAVAEKIASKYMLAQFEAPKPITSEKQNEVYTAALLALEREDSRRGLSVAQRAYAELLTMLIEKFEEEQYKISDASPVQVLAELIQANGLKQKDLIDIFKSESTVSEILKGTRSLNTRHIRGLAKKFNVSPAVFI